MRNFFIPLALVIGTSATVASETDWQNHQDIIQTRLVGTSLHIAGDEHKVYAWEAKLADGWKTYWRSPGEAGLPVRAFSDKTELDIEYPFPERFELFGLETYGYSKYVVLPFKLEAEGAGASIDVDFMVCKEICVPFRASYDLEQATAGDYSIHDEKVSNWLEKVPAKEGGDSAELDIVSAKVVGPAGKQKIIVEAKGSSSLTQADMLAEVNDMFHFGKPKMKLLGDGTKARFVLPAMTGKKPQDLRSLKVRLTFTDGKGASIERTFDLNS